MLLRVDDLTGTHAVAAAIAGVARAGDVIVLAGEMGAGKTAFAQGFGRALGVTEPITSPTFTLVHSYPLSRRLTLHHADIYRLERTSDIDDLALHELAAFNGIVLVEWGDVAGVGAGRSSRGAPQPRRRADDDDDDARWRRTRDQPPTPSTPSTTTIRRRRLRARSNCARSDRRGPAAGTGSPARWSRYRC